MSYWVVGSTAATLLAGYDAKKSAKHQAKVQNEIQQNQIRQANLRAEKELAMTARLQEQQLAAQRRLQDQQLAVQRQLQAESLAAAALQAAETKAQMDQQLKMADEAKNRANQKTPNTRQILSEAEQAGKAGVSGTMLTGPQGIDPSSLTLGRNSLLGY